MWMGLMHAVCCNVDNDPYFTCFVCCCNSCQGFTQFYRYGHNLSREVWTQNYKYSFRLVTTFISSVPRRNTGKMFPDSKKQRRISDLSTLCRVVQKTHKVKLNFVRKCKFWLFIVNFTDAISKGLNTLAQLELIRPHKVIRSLVVKFVVFCFSG